MKIQKYENREYIITLKEIKKKFGIDEKVQFRSISNDTSKLILCATKGGE